MIAETPMGGIGGRGRGTYVSFIVRRFTPGIGLFSRLVICFISPFGALTRFA